MFSLAVKAARVTFAGRILKFRVRQRSLEYPYCVLQGQVAVHNAGLPVLYTVRPLWAFV